MLFEIQKSRFEESQKVITELFRSYMGLAFDIQDQPTISFIFSSED